MSDELPPSAPTPPPSTPSGIEVCHSDVYKNMADTVEMGGRRFIRLHIATDLEGRALEVAIGQMIHNATVVEFQVDQLNKAQPWKIQLQWQAMQPRREVIRSTGGRLNGKKMPKR